MVSSIYTNAGLHLRQGPNLKSHTVDIPQALKDSLRKFRFARRSQGSAALIVKINRKELVMEEQEQFDNISIEELAEGTLNESITGLGSSIIFDRAP